MAERNRDQWNNPNRRDWDQNEGHYGHEHGYEQKRSGYGGGYGNVNYDRDYDQDRYQQDRYEQNRRIDYGSMYGSGYGGGYEGDYSRKNYGGYGEASGMGGPERGNIGSRDWRRESEYGGEYGGGYMGTGMEGWRNRDMNQNQGYYGGGYGSSEIDWGRGGQQNRRWRQMQGGRGSSQGSSYGDYGYGQGYGRRDSERERRDRRDRSWWDKTADEVSSWFGDEDAERRRERDRQMEAMHKGKGPKGYQRSDERIKEDVCDRLSDDDYLDASDIDVQVTGHEVI